MFEKVNKNLEYGLFAEIMDTFSTWEGQSEDVVNKGQLLSKNGKLICVSDLEVNSKH